MTKTNERDWDEAAVLRLEYCVAEALSRRFLERIEEWIEEDVVNLLLESHHISPAYAEMPPDEASKVMAASMAQSLKALLVPTDELFIASDIALHLEGRR